MQVLHCSEHLRQPCRLCTEQALHLFFLCRRLLDLRTRCRILGQGRLRTHTGEPRCKHAQRLHRTQLKQANTAMRWFCCNWYNLFTISTRSRAWDAVMHVKVQLFVEFPTDRENQTSVCYEMLTYWVFMCSRSVATRVRREME